MSLMRRFRIFALIGCWIVSGLCAVGEGTAGDLFLSDPAKVSPPPPGAIGFPDRGPNLDVLPGFRNPPPGYGEVAFYWWLGDPLTKERLAWQLDQLAGNGVMGLQINYAHSDRGGHSYGLTFPSDPPLFSDEWWKLVGWFMQEAKQRGMAVSLSDYTLGIGQGWKVDELLRERPDLTGSVLQADVREVAGGDITWSLPAEPLMVSAYDRSTSAVTDLRGFVRDCVLTWTVPPGQYRLVAVRAQRVEPSLDPLHPDSGNAYADSFFGQFEQHNPGEGGKGLNFFFSDELEFRVSGNLWTQRFAEEFQRRKGYDLVPELPALFVDIGPRTPKIRLDYRDVMVSLTEEGFFKPVFDWHQARGMIYGCDHGGRGRNVVEFGDYFRTQRWNQGPGCDQPGLGRDLIKNKVASSIAHLYQRPRVWLEGFYGSGWGTTSAGLADATFANFAQGQNLLTLHGLYYSTHGGWWEWAPPCNHFRLPYWKHMHVFMDCVQRLSYLLSQGVHRCDVAILYPVAPMEADLGGNEAVQAAFDAGEQLYRAGIDFDFMDFESLDRCAIEGRELCVSGERFRVLVLPAMRAVRWSTLQKALEFQRAGGIVLALGALPEASDRVGRDDPDLIAVVQELFGANESRAASAADVIARVTAAFPRDFVSGSGSPHFMHRRIGARDLYFVYGTPRDTECTFRATGAVELWDPWTGQTRPLEVIEQSAEQTRLHMPLSEQEPQLIVFSAGTPRMEKPKPAATPTETVVEGEWEFELQPTMDNRWGDFHWPATDALIGAEARQFRYADESTANPPWFQADYDDSAWQKVTHSFGPQFWKLGPLPADCELAQLKTVDPSQPVLWQGREYRWAPYEFSWRWGIEGDPGHQGYHGLKEEVDDHFIALGKLQQTATGSNYVAEDGGSRYYLATSVVAPTEGTYWPAAGGHLPTAVWLNGQSLSPITAAASLNVGGNALVLQYDGPGRGYYVLATEQQPSSAASGSPFSAAAHWIWYPQDRTTAERYFHKRFTLTSRPATAQLRITCDNGYRVAVNGRDVGSGNRWEAIQEYDVSGWLLAGENQISVRASNEGDSAGLIAELVADEMRVATDGSWDCARTKSDAPVPAEAIAKYTDSLWVHHVQGPPKLESPIVASPARLEVKPLASRWDGDPAILPFATRAGVAHPAGWYRFVSPPGLKALSVRAQGKVQAWANGVPMQSVNGVRFTVTSPHLASVVVALRIEQDQGFSGGAAVPDPVQLECGPGTLALGDWAQVDGLATYSGGAWYRKTIHWERPTRESRVVLDLGDVSASAEVHLNGKLMGTRVAPPWTFDVTESLQPGANRIEVLIYNTLANHYLTVPTRYRGSTVSGLLGPVRLRELP